MMNPLDQAAAAIAQGAPERLKAATESGEVKRITGQIGTLRQAEVDLSRRFLTLRGELAVHRAGIGEAALDSILQADETPGGPLPGSGELAAAITEGEVLTSAIDAARGRRRDALKDRPAAIARALRRGELAKVNAEAAAHGRKAAKALQALEELEGCRYVPAGLAAAGAVIDGFDGLLPRSAIYQAQVGALEAEAVQAEGARIRDAGTLTGRSREDMIRAALEVAPETIGPSIPDLLGWLDSAEPEALERLRRMPGVIESGESLFFHLVYSGGQVDPARSRIIIPAVDHREAGELNVRPIRPVHEPV